MEDVVNRIGWTMFIAGAFLLGSATPSFGSADDPGGTFWDDDHNIHEAQIEAIAAAGITFGCGSDLYCPDQAVTRGQMAAFLRRGFNLPVSGVDYFADDDDSEFERDINSLAAAGITVGCNQAGDRFCPNDPVKRDQMASFLARALKLTPLVPAERPSFTVAFTGDILLHLPVDYAAANYGKTSGKKYDFEPMFTAIKPIIGAADLGICHLEVPLHPESVHLSGYPSFQGPAEIADAIVAAGYQGCSVASNHSYDQGVTGIKNTLDVMTSRGLGYDGMAYDLADRLAAQTYTVGDVTIAHLSYADWLNGLRLPSDKPWLVNLVDADVVISDAERARQAGADVVLVSIHWGTEYQVDPTAAQTKLANTLTAADSVDLVVGHHAHVVQPIGQYGSEYVIYGLGNSLSNQLWSAQTTDGLLVTVEMAWRNGDWMPRDVAYTPTWVQAGTYRILPVAETLRSGNISSTLRSQLLGSWARTTKRVERLGADVRPSTVP